MPLPRGLRAVLSIALFSTALLPARGEAAKQAPLLSPYPKSVRVANVQQLVSALGGAVRKQTILLADGVYDVSGVEPLRMRVDSLMLYGESRDPAKVILKGKGFTNGDINEEMIKVEAAQATLAYLTLRDVRSNGLKLQTGGNHNLLVHNVHFIDICERSIKGPQVAVSRGGIIRYCLFEQRTPITSAIPNLNADGDYIAGMDLMKVEDWRIHDNVFLNIRGKNGGGRAGIFLWVGCRNMTVEGNLFMGCDRSISFGNPSGTAADMVGGIIRNNFIVAGRDISIELCNASNTRVLNNTVYSDQPAFTRTLFLLNGGAGNAIKNNLIFGKMMIASGAVPDTARNLFLGSGNPATLFVDASRGDLHLLATGLQAIDKGAKVEDVNLDWDGDPRAGALDIGADERSSSSGLSPSSGPTPSGNEIRRTGREGDLILFTGKGKAVRADGRREESVSGAKPPHP